MNTRVIKRLLYTIMLMLCITAVSRLHVEAKAIYTGNRKVDCAVETIIHRASKKGMSREQKLKACYIYLVKHMT